ncbi:2Fe-2S iron-sulfur cluster-binding protein [Hyphomicrobium sp.]|uniref:2Fe-2S iron-sulfur cluster-binding protein n=1 Tax=Hyphomicrobium sp. TaxID=82 RepID=UPI002E339C3E|nr:2Fe-2S iron-sulfur cluster-binding protein [Hyphomicrobium sp.]HEX2843588.1 2Fe-2S iron-sulfur cluster-binding protein [Hyphomicrobium sp.]
MSDIEILVESVAANDPVTVRGRVGTSLMETIRKAGLELEGACGGSLACASCHVVISVADYEKVGPPGDEEEDMLDQAFGVTRTSRLSCQILLTSELDGLRIRLPVST